MYFGDVAYALLQQGKLPDAEAACRAWWAMCRRHRPLGQVENDLALGLLAQVVAAQGDMAMTMTILQCRITLAQAARGRDSDVAVKARTPLENWEAR